MRNPFKALFTGLDRTETIVWHCDPLVIVHPTDGIVYAGTVEVEFTPDDPSCKTGTAVALITTNDGWRPEIRIMSRTDYANPGDVQTRVRGGMTLLGNDIEGEPFTWYVNGPADRYLVAVPGSTRSIDPTTGRPRRALDKGDAGAVTPADLELLTELTERPLDRDRLEVFDCRPLVVMATGKEIVFEGEAQVESVPYKDGTGGHVVARTTLGTGVSQELYVLRVEGTPWMPAGGTLFGLNDLGEASDWWTNDAAFDLIAQLDEAELLSEP